MPKIQRAILSVTDKTGIVEFAQKLVAMNTTTKVGLHYIHSGTYAELAAHYGLDAKHLSETILKTLKTKKEKAGSL